MGECLLSLDLGNSRCKLRLWRAEDAGPECVARADFELEARLTEHVGLWLDTQPPLAGAVLSSVATPELTLALTQALAARSLMVRSSPPAGLENRCRFPAEVGRDRLYAARGALELVGRSAIVVDAGTALTVDALEVPEPGRGIFLGGTIAPGPTLGAEALASGAARLPAVDLEPGASALGRDTAQAIRGGLVLGFRGAAAALVEALRSELGWNAAPVVLSGGARPFLLEPAPFVPGELVLAPDLVHLGLLCAAWGEELHTSGADRVDPAARAGEA